MIEINYDNTLEETRKGYTRFYNKYAMKRMVLFTIVYAIAFVLGLDLLLKNPTGFYGPILMALSLGLIVSQWLRPYLMKRRLLKTLEGLNEERYTARFYDDRIVVETEILPSDQPNEVIAITRDGIDTVENEAVIADAEEQILTPEPTVISYANDVVYIDEDDSAFRIFLNRTFVFVLPKRCMNDEQMAALDKYFEEKNL